MAKILTQDEIEALLKGLSGGEVETGFENDDDHENVAVCDLTNQDHPVWNRMPALEIINERFAHLFKQTMSAALRKTIDVSAFSIDMTKFSEFMKTLPAPTSLHIFKAAPLRGHAIMVLEANLVFNLVDSFSGGNGWGDIKAEERDFTPIESQLVTKVIKMALNDLEKAWNPVQSLTFSYVRGETNPQFALVTAPTEMVVAIKFEVKLEQTVGTLIICLPCSTIEPIRSKLYADFQSDPLEIDTAWLNRFIERVKEAEVNLKVELGRTMVTGADLMKLAIGDVIRLKHDIREPLEVKVEGVPKFKVLAGTARGQKAVRIVDEMPPKFWEK